MKPAPFDYLRAHTLDEALDALAAGEGEAIVLAGGQTLVPMMAMRLARPAWVIDINEISDLKYIRVEGAALRMGACTRQRVAERDAQVRDCVPLVRQALRWVGHVQTRNRGTVGGSLAHADPCAELPLAARVLDAEVGARSSRGMRTLKASELFVGPMTTALDPDELIEEVAWPIWRESNCGSAFAELSIRHGDFAIVAAAAQIALDNGGRCVRASFGVGGADATPVAFPELAATLIGSQVEDALLASVAQRAAEMLDPGNDLHASPEYRRRLATVLAGRVLREARDHALTSSGERYGS